MANVSSTTTPISIAGGSSAAAAGGSVIDVSSLVSQLVTATRAPQDSVIAGKTQSVTTQISAIGTLKGALSSFQSSLASLATPTAFNSETASTSDSSIFTAAATPNAAAGTYSVAVAQLAQAQQLVSGAFAGGAAAVLGTGTLQLSLGGTSFEVAIGSNTDTLTGIAGAINAAAGNPGITATVISGTDGAHLVLSSTLTGAANTIQVAETDGGSALAALAYAPANTAGYTENSPAQDAQFSIAGISHTSSSNTVSDALSGVTFTLVGKTAAGAGPGSSATLTVANDNAAIQANISAFVTAYNTLSGALAQLGSFDPTTRSAGPMLGDALLSGIRNQIRATLYSVVNTGSSTYNTLASIGITTNSDGTLSLNSARLAAALAAAPSAVSALFSGSGGIGAHLDQQVTAQLSSGGSIDSRSQTLIKEENALTDQTHQLDAQMTALTASLTQQYSVLNTLLSSLQTTSAFLTQQFAALPTAQRQNK